MSVHPDGPHDIYVLCHPENPSNLEPDAVHFAFHPDNPTSEWGLHPSFGDVIGVIRAVKTGQGNLIAAAAAECGRQVLIDDGTIADHLEDHCPDDDGPFEILPGLPEDGWETVQAEPHELAKLKHLFPAGSRVLLGGYARNDCVRRLAAALRRGGCTVDLHEQVTLPLTDEALGYWI